MGRFGTDCGCGCGGAGGCSPRATMGDVYGDCDSFQVILSGGPVEALRARLDPEWQATDMAVRACSALSPEERAAWAGKLEAWEKSKAVEAGTWNGNALFRATCALGKDLESWRAYMAPKCTMIGPNKIVDAQHDGAAAIKWVGIAVAALAVAYVATPILMPLLRRRG